MYKRLLIMFFRFLLINKPNKTEVVFYFRVVNGGYQGLRNQKSSVMPWFAHKILHMTNHTKLYAKRSQRPSCETFYIDIYGTKQEHGRAAQLA